MGFRCSLFFLIENASRLFRFKSMPQFNRYQHKGCFITMAPDSIFKGCKWFLAMAICDVDAICCHGFSSFRHFPLMVVVPTRTKIEHFCPLLIKQTDIAVTPNPHPCPEHIRAGNEWLRHAVFGLVQLVVVVPVGSCSYFSHKFFSCLHGNIMLTHTSVMDTP